MTQSVRKRFRPAKRQYKIETDGTTVWVNSETGMCIGRFGRNGVDVHRDFEAQLELGNPMPRLLP